MVDSNDNAAWDAKQAALEYLASTDWYVIRSIEDPTKPVPDDIKAARAAARVTAGI